MIKISQKIIDKFAIASGGLGEIHTDENFASKSFYGKTIAHGLLVIGLIEKELTRRYPDWGLNGYLDIVFIKPVHPGSILAIEIERIDKIKHKIEVFSDGVKAVSGEALIPKSSI
jgi:3-hydroxybutyryl-CoA dehydratase